jgi:hypothetical protein
MIPLENGSARADPSAPFSAPYARKTRLVPTRAMQPLALVLKRGFHCRSIPRPLLSTVRSSSFLDVRITCSCLVSVVHDARLALRPISKRCRGNLEWRTLNTRIGDEKCTSG